MPPLDSWELARYSRHLLLDEVGAEGQQKLKDAKVLCIGAGGLGSPVLLYLAAAGVGRIGIVDFDVVEESNLQRQVIHGSAAVGRSKLASAKARILDINPRCAVDLFETALTSENALEILGPYDVVVDGSDNFPTRYLANDACVILGKPYVYGSIFKFEGQASVFNYDGGPNYRDLYPQPPPPGLVPSCAEGGVLGILPGVIGAIQATETVKILLGKGTSLSGRLLLYDALEMSFREVRLGRDPEAPVIDELIDYDQFCGVPSRKQFVSVTAAELVERRAAGWMPFVLDVRREDEAAQVALPLTDHRITHKEVGEHLGEIPRDRDVLVYCKSGARSQTAIGTLAAAGFTRLFQLEGGITAWSDRGDPSISRY
jgi:sulfur-carrier protein adenylyltransferase/sulfurtransferase